MKKHFYMFPAIMIFALMISCGGKKYDEIKTNMDNMGKLKEASENIQQNMNAGEAKRQERIKSGDTLAMHYTKLREFLPASIPGYDKMEDTEGTTANITGFTLSTVTRRFTKEADGSYIEIQLVDYNQAEGMYQSMTFWAAGIETESDTKLEKTFKPPFDNAVAYEIFYKKDKEAEVTYALNWRFLMNIKANNQTSADFVKNVANSMMKTKELAAI